MLAWQPVLIQLAQSLMQHLPPPDNALHEILSQLAS